MTNLTSVDLFQLVYENSQMVIQLAIISFVLYFLSTLLVTITRKKEPDGPRFPILPVGIGAFTNYLAYVFGRDGIEASRRFGVFSIRLLRASLLLLMVSLFTMFTIGVAQSNLSLATTTDAAGDQE